MLCSNCKSIINKEDKFCSICGAEVRIDSSIEQDKKQQENINSGDKNIEIDETKNISDSEKTQKIQVDKKNSIICSNNFVVSILLAIICVSFAFTCIRKYVIYNSKEIYLYSDFPNISHGWIYYMNNINDNSINNEREICKEKEDGSSKSIIITDTIMKMDYDGSYIYYMNGDTAFYKIKTDGTGKKKLPQIPDVNWELYKNKIYYSSNGAIYRMNTDGTNMKCIYKDLKVNNFINAFHINYDKIYIRCNNNKGPNVYSIDIYGKNKNEIYSGKGNNVFPIEIKDKYLFCIKYDSRSINGINGINGINDIKIIRVGLGNKNEKILAKKGDYIGISGNWMYYCNMGDNNKLYKVQLNGENNRKVSDRSIFHGNINSKRIYYYDDNDKLCSMKLDGSNYIMLEK